MASGLTRPSVSAETLHSSEDSLNIPASLTPAQRDIFDSAIHGQRRPETGDVSSAAEIKDMKARDSSDSPRGLKSAIVISARSLKMVFTVISHTNMLISVVSLPSLTNVHISLLLIGT